MRILFTFYLLGIIIDVSYSQDTVDVNEHIPKSYETTDTVFFRTNRIREVLYFDKHHIVKTKLTFYETGGLQSCLNYNEHSVFEGKINYWYESGKRKIESYYKGGKMIGNQNYAWNENGNIEYQTNCVMDTCISVYYYPDGNIERICKSILIELFYEEKRCENGQIILIDSIGINRMYNEYYCNGILKISSAKNKRGAFIGSYKLYFENNQLSSMGEFLDHKGFESKKNGIWQYYNKKGEKLLEEYYENGVLINQIPMKN